jgi:2-oxoglutarate dehydrogenase E1 component
MTSGKLYYDLSEARKKLAESRVALVRLEQFYPFPLSRIRSLIATYLNAKQLVWAQEEPKNMGGWGFMESRLENLLPACQRPIYVGRAPSASPATGSYAIHQLEQTQLVNEALSVR